MMRVKWVALTLALALASVQAPAAERRYVQLETGNLVVVSALGEGETRLLAHRIAMFREALETALGVPLPGALPTRLYALSDEDWKGYAQPRPGVAGYFLAHPFASDLLLNAQDDTSSAFEIVLHEYTHHLLRTSLTAEIPAFLDEGLAELFSTAQFDERAIRIQFRNDHAEYLRHHEWLPFPRLTGVKRTDTEYVDHALAPAFYAQSWATLYYAAAKDEPHGWRIAQYLRARERGMGEAQAAERLVGVDLTAANADIEMLVRRRRQPVLEIPLQRNAAIEHASIRALDHHESTLALAELLLQFGDRSDKALELFEQVRQEPLPSARANVGAAWAHLQAGRRDAAGKIFDSTADPPPHERKATVALARGLFQLGVDNLGGQTPDGVRRERLVRARSLFGDCVKDRSVWLEAVNGFVLTRMALDEHDESLIRLASEAYAAAPKSAELGVALAILHELGGRKDIARQYWQEAARNTHAAPMRARILDALQANQSSAEDPQPR